MKRASSFLALLALGFIACSDHELTAPDRQGRPALDQAASGPVVNSLDDVTGEDGCTDTHCSLREAIALADPGATISFGVTGTIVLTAGLVIDKSLTIAGPGAASLSVSGNHQVRVFDIAAGTAVRISGLKITAGSAIEGAGILNYSEDLVLSEVIVTGNHVQGTSANTSSVGGGISNHGTLTLENSAVTGNAAMGPVHWHGAGIYSNGTLTVTNSAITLNYGQGNGTGVGGGIQAGGTATITNSTVSNNGARGANGWGGGIYSQGTSSTLTLVNSTIANNASETVGGGLYIAYTSLSLTNTIVADNFAQWDAPDLKDGGTVTARHTLIGDAVGHSVTDGVDGNIVGVSAAELLLAELADNGGPTRTLALLPGSPAIDAGTASGCPATDQRGVLRPQGAGCDIGAYEVRAYAFTGFLNPVANSPLLTEMKAGQAVPVKFSLNGAQGASVLASGYPTSVQFACDLSSGTSLVEETVSAGASGLSYDPLTDTYTYVWKTDKSWANTCRRLTLQFADEAGTTRTADFRFIK